jgi:hypothetical protein
LTSGLDVGRGRRDRRPRVASWQAPRRVLALWAAAVLAIAGIGCGDSDSGSSDESSDVVVRTERQQPRAKPVSQLPTRKVLEREAADRGIEVTDAEVGKRWEAARKDGTERSLQPYAGGQKKGPLFELLRLQILTERIQAQIFKQAGGGEKGATAVQRYFLDRWRNGVRCTVDHTAAGCGESE